MTTIDYLRKPYARRLTPTEEGGFVATIQEFPGLVAEGQTAEASLTALDNAARAWIDAALASGREIPEPVNLTGYSGKVALRMPRGLHKRAVEMASSENVSLNQWIVTAVSCYLGGHEAVNRTLLPALQSFRMNVFVNFAVTSAASTQPAPVKHLPISTSLIRADNFTAPAIAFGSAQYAGG